MERMIPKFLLSKGCYEDQIDGEASHKLQEVSHNQTEALNRALEVRGGPRDAPTSCGIYEGKGHSRNTWDISVSTSMSL